MRRPRGVGDGGTLRARLLVLALVPLLAVVGFASVEVSASSSTAAEAQRARAHVVTVGHLSEARTGLMQELVPALARALSSRGSVAPGYLSVPLSTLSSSEKSIAHQRARTDRALRVLRHDPATAALAVEVASSIGLFRQHMDTPDDVTSGFEQALEAVRRLGDAQYGEAAHAVQAGLAGSAARSVDDLERVSAMAQDAQLEQPYLIAALLPFPGRTSDDRQAWFETHGSYRAALADVLAHGTDAAVADVRDVVTLPAVLNFDAEAPQAVTAARRNPATDVRRLSAIYPSAAQRSEAFGNVVDRAVDRAVAAAVAQSRTAQRSVWLILGVIGLLLAVSLAVTRLVLRSVSAPLEVLAKAALRVSQGVLKDVPIGGPREIRIVARGLAAAVASLRNIEAQAEAVAAGRLDHPVLQQPINGPLGAVVHASVETMVAAIRARDAARNDLAHRASHDSLTQLPNRAQAMVVIERALMRAQRRPASTAILFVDLDYFKIVNDTWGHEVGDVVLQTVAQRLLAAVRGGDTVARLGGDEFIIVLEDVAVETDPVRLAERVIAEVSRPMEVKQLQIKIGASVGLSLAGDGDTDAQGLINEADTAAYRAKREGRGRLEVFDDELRQQLSTHAEIEAAVAIGLIGEEFELYYQPMVDLRTRATVGFEALVRWNRPGRGIVLPDQFIPIAEASSLIEDLGSWILGDATAQLARWDEQLGTNRLSVAVNVSGRQLTAQHFVEDVRAAVAKAGIAPTRLTLELTETVLVDHDVATRTIERLRAIGVRIAIDDFGTGYTSIGQLPNLPIDTLKIDRSFVASAEPRQQDLVRLIAAAAHAFDLEVVAEGIETVEQLDALLECGVEAGQGYLFGHPAPASLALAAASLAPMAGIPFLMVSAPRP